jgi:3-oxoacyl-[acyl-carrier-protein] synthase-3
MDAYIKAIAYHLPEYELTNEELNQSFPDWSVDKISAKTGIYTRHIAAKDEFASDLAIKAATKLFVENNINPDTVDFILYCTQSPDYFLPTTACILQEKLGLPNTAGALDFNLGCSGFVYGLSIAKGLIFSKSAKNVLFITAETYSKYIHPEDRSNRTIFGDAATASLITAEKGIYGIGSFRFGTDGSGAENLIVKNGGIKNKSAYGVNIYEDNLFFRNDDNLLSLIHI